jgi:hypothetical protein
MADQPRWPEWMDQKVLAAYIGKKPSTVRTLMKHPTSAAEPLGKCCSVE